MDEPLALSSVPAGLAWRNPPLKSTSDGGRELGITAGAQTDWFVDPAGEPAKHNAPIALFAPPDPAFRLQARVSVAFAARYDAGTLFAYADDTLWAKLCFEYSPQRQPTVVSVVTRGLSDDCNSAGIGDDAVYLRLYRQGPALAFHYSQDGRYWQLVRYFSLGNLERLSVGFSAQSPAGRECTAIFSEILYTPGVLPDLRNGE